MSTTDVLICGAGAAGLTLAIDLARRGVTFRLIDKLPSPFEGSRGKGIQPRSMEVFEDLGVLADLQAAGGPYPTMRVYRDDGGHSDESVVGEAVPTPAEPWSMPWMCPQSVTERILRDRLAALGGQVDYACELVDFELRNDAVVATLAGARGKETMRVRYLVGGDGGRSFVRQALGIDFPGKSLGVRGLVADVTLHGLARDAWHRFGGQATARQIGICPLAGTDLFQIQAAVPLEGEVDTSPAALQAMVDERTGRDDIRLGTVAWASVYRMSARLAERYRVGRVLLMGDAAHTHPPTGGQGLNTSVQDAYNLGWKLAAVLAGAPDALLATYEDERRPIAAGMLGLSTRLLDAARRGEMRRTRETRQLDLAYPDTALALELPPRNAGLRAGARAPDAPLVDAATGSPVRLFERFKGPHWTLLGRDTDAAAVEAHPDLQVHVVGDDGDLVDVHGHFRDAWALAPGEWALVRPDGYIAARVDASHLGTLRAWLGRQLGWRE